MGNRFSKERLKCKGNKDNKILKVYEICNNNAAANNCKYNNTKNYKGNGIYEKWYRMEGKMEVNLKRNGKKRKNIYIFKLINEKKLSNIAGVTLIEILIGILISV